MNVADWIILFILLFAVAAAAVVFVILTIMNIGGILRTMPGILRRKEEGM